MANDVLVERDGAVLTVTLNRPEKYNALTFAMYTGVAEALGRVPEGVRAVILTGAGSKAFAAGTDISQFRDFRTPEDGIAYEARIDAILTAIESCPVPVIAAIAGACTGGGAAMAACCDMRLATRDLRFGFPIARTLGNCLSAASLARLTAIVGAPRVYDIMYTARLIEAEEARAIGLVGEVLADHTALMARARALAGEIAANAPLTIATTKELMRRLRAGGPGASGPGASGPGPGRAAVDDRDLVGRIYTSADFREGLAAFLEKRKPKWTGR